MPANREQRNRSGIASGAWNEGTFSAGADEPLLVWQVIKSPLAVTDPLNNSPVFSTNSQVIILDPPLILDHPRTPIVTVTGGPATVDITLVGTDGYGKAIAPKYVGVIFPTGPSSLIAFKRITKIVLSSAVPGGTIQIAGSRSFGLKWPLFGAVSGATGIAIYQDTVTPVAGDFSISSIGNSGGFDAINITSINAGLGDPRGIFTAGLGNVPDGIRSYRFCYIAGRVDKLEPKPLVVE